MPHEAKAGDSVVRWGKGHVVILKRMERFGGGGGVPNSVRARGWPDLHHS